MKGKHWGSLTGSVAAGYQQVGGESHSGGPSGKFIPTGKSEGYDQTTVGSHGGKVSGKFLGATKNSPNPNKSS